MGVFVINEWLWHDLSGENGTEAQTESLKAVIQFRNSKHRLVVAEGSSFDQKAWKLCKSHDMMIRQVVVRDYVLAVRWDLNRCVVLKPHNMAELPDDLAHSTKPDDHYLLRCLLSVEEAILVTTDGDLCEAVVRAQKPCLSREQFLAEYLF